MSTKLTADEIKLRGSLLAKNKDLLKLHKDLVSSKILTEEEFWEDRRGLLRAQEMILKQKRGVTSSLVADDLKPANTSSVDIKYVLTPTIIQTIFEQHPVLKKAFNHLVTTEQTLTERDFWIEYFKSKFFNESKVSQGSSGSIHLDPYYQETSSITDESDESNVKVSALYDISRSEDDRVSDYLRYEREAAANDPSWNSLRQFNKHSLRVLQALKSEDSQIINNFDLKYIEIPDLQLTHEPEMAALSVQESQLFAKDKDKTSSTADHILLNSSDLKKIVTELNKRTSDAFDASKFQVNYPQSKEMFTQIYNRNNFKLDTTGNTNLRSDLSLTEEDSQILNSSIEILRHFWKTAAGNSGPLPTKMTAERAAKLTRLISVLERTEEKLSGNNRLGNLKDVILKAKQKYSELVK